MKILKTILMAIVLTLIGGGFVFMMLWSFFETDSRYGGFPDYVDGSLLLEPKREIWISVNIGDQI